MSYNNLRKTWCLYYSFLNFGWAALSGEAAWFIGTVVRSSTVQMLKGGLSAIAGEFLRLMFRTEHCVMTGGFTLQLKNGRVVRIWARLTCNVSDEAALKTFWKCKGAGGLKLCLLCLNCVDCGSDLWFFDATGRLIPHTCPNIGQFIPHTKESVMTVLEHLKHVKSNTPGSLQEQEKFHGWLEPTHNLLMTLDIGPLLDPSTQTCFDWAHCFLIHGIFNRQMYELLKAIAPLTTSTEIEGYMQLWRWPKRLEGKAVSGKQAFSEKRLKNSNNAKTFNASASEGLSIYPVMAHYLRRHCLPAFNRSGEAQAIQHCEAFFALCHVLDLLMHVHDDKVTPDLLGKALADHADAFVTLLGPAACLPKNHFALHIAQFLERFGVLPNCLVHERKHKLIKRFLEESCFTSP